MSQTLYRIYRYSERDPFGAPRGWLAFQEKKGKLKQQWVPSDELTSSDRYSRGEASYLKDQWNTYWYSKGWNMRAAMEVAE